MVLGMHRSGTSAITKGLEVLGVDLGDNLIPPQEDNPKGFFEDRELIELNERILKKTGHSWYDLAPIDPALMTGPDLLTERLEAGAFIRRKLNASEAVGLKDPRLSILMPFWFDVLQDIDVETGYIIPVRNPLAVARSLLVRDGLMLERGAALCAFTCDGVHSSDLAFFLDQEGVAVRAGHHCTQPLHKRLGADGGTVRASLALYNTEAEVEAFLAALDRVLADLEDDSDFVPLDL